MPDFSEIQRLFREIGRPFNGMFTMRREKSANSQLGNTSGMDTLRGKFADGADPADDRAFDADDEDLGLDRPASPVGDDERRMQVRAYNHWASLIQDRNFPSIDDLDPDSLPDFGPCSVLLDFSYVTENPGIAYLGDRLAAEC